jgi:PAS domain S-box-containing protein
MSLPSPTSPEQPIVRCARTHHRADGTFVTASPAVLEVYGVAPEAIVGRRLRDVIADEDTEHADRALGEAMRSTDAVCLVVRLREAARRIEIVAHAERDGGEDFQLCCVARDAAAGARAIAEQAQLSSRADELGRRLQRLIANVPGAVWELWFVEDPSRQRVSFASERCLALSGYTPEEWLSTRDFWAKVTHPDDLPQARAVRQRALAEGGGSARMRWITKDGRIVWVESRIQVLRNEDGSPAGLCGVTMDITARKEAEDEQARLREEIIQSQARLLAELSTPLIPLSAGVIALPLVGAIDRARAQRVVETLLHGISAAGARFAILDITGVPAVDTHVADALLKAARGVKLLGAEIVLTGICPEVAQTLVTLGADLAGIVTLGTLEAGIRYATRERRGS